MCQELAGQKAWISYTGVLIFMIPFSGREALSATPSMARVTLWAGILDMEGTSLLGRTEKAGAR
ncbi:uncharacterized protein GLRG_04493 [Colletotrichum graminicola M1.001]|uniref:Uncharacterized protein n=1 Tax=Colletotrichum graminicola (strain M1.001 / M2 / FGSC 10212) TaxID=645133 RepID=E3QEP3_COLGM|nr:uncharacterized protein GLRG_04493 [Colletotrichum graminicola M1.001]EFQ29349.1 hypothetical protein GLRG_04493 [Colletotrichum graminicola M1.001]